MNDVSVTLPHHLQVFMRAIKPVYSHFRSARGERIIPSSVPQNFFEDMSQLLQPLQSFASNVGRIIGDGLGGVAQRKDATEVQIFAAVRDFEHSLEALLAGYRRVRAVRVQAENEQIRGWIEGMYRHTLDDVGDWLDDLVDALDDPTGAIVKRGLPLGGHVNIPLELKLTAPPQVAQIAAYFKEQAEIQAWSNKQPEIGRKKSKGLGFLATLGHIWIGCEIAECLFGGDED